MYKVLVKFADGENGKRWPLDKGGYIYAVGETYPKGDFEPSEGHIAYLLNPKNKMGRPVIEQVDNDDDNLDLTKMSKDELIAFASGNNIPIGDAKTKADILAAIEESLKV